MAPVVSYAQRRTAFIGHAQQTDPPSPTLETTYTILHNQLQHYIGRLSLTASRTATVYSYSVSKLLALENSL